MVTGENGGLGRRISHALAEAGSNVAVVCCTWREHADQVVTCARTDSTTGQTLVIDAGRLFH